MEGFIEGIFPGIAAMANIHPMVIHFPIALLNAFLLMEVLGAFFRSESLRIAAGWMLYLGTVGAAAAVAAGLRAGATVPHTDEVHAIMTRHMYLGITVLVLAVILSIWRIRSGGRFSFRSQIFHILVALLVSGVMAFGADLGGLMVYGHGVGVKAVKPTPGHSHDAAAPHTHDNGHSH